MLQEKPSALKRKHPALQNKKFLHFFLFLWVVFALLDPDPDPDPACCRSATLSLRVYTPVFSESSETRNFFFFKQYKFVRGCTCTPLFCTVTVKGTV
jgi:hypothetical protein